MRHMEGFYKKKIEGLQELINMIVHDLRNPSYLIDSSLDKLAMRIGINVEQ
jgi:hypothetical protein